MAGLARSNLPAETPGAKIGLGLLDKRQTAHGDALRPFSFPELLFAFESLFNPASVRQAQLFAAADAKQLHQRLPVNQPVSFGRFLNLAVAAVRPFGGVLDDACPDHIQVHVDDTLNQVLTGLHCRCMIAVFPECAFSVFPLIVLLSSTTCRQLSQLCRSLANFRRKSFL